LNYKVAIIGTGRVASILAHRIPASVRKVIIGQSKAEAARLADEVGGVASEQMSAVRGCRVVLLALDGAALPQALAEIQPHLTEGAVVVNMAADLLTGDIGVELEGARLVAAKVIGHPREMELGSPGVVLLDRVEPADAALLEPLLADVGPVIRGDERQAAQAHRFIVESMTRAVAELRRRLAEAGLAADLVTVAIGATAPGVLRDLASEAGPVDASVRHKMEAGESATSGVSH
jgi:pyrroline-5-carboxylate reductase